MKTKNKAIKILSVILCMITLVTALIVPISAEETTEESAADTPSLYSAADGVFNANDVTLLIGSKYRDVFSTVYNDSEYTRVSFSIASDRIMMASLPVSYENSTIVEKQIRYTQLDVFFSEYFADTTLVRSMTFIFDANLTYEIKHSKDIAVSDSVSKLYTTYGDEYVDYSWNTNIRLLFGFWIDLEAISSFEIESCNGGSIDFAAFSSRFMLLSKRRSPKYYTDGYNDGLQQGISDGYDTGYWEGYDFGYETGFTDGYNDGDYFGYKRGYDTGLIDGFNGADTSQAWSNMKNLIFSIFDAPFYVISTALDFDLFGINIAGTLIALISLAIIVWILKIIIVKLF